MKFLLIGGKKKINFINKFKNNHNQFLKKNSFKNYSFSTYLLNKYVIININKIDSIILI